jgi:DNA-binding transcriptional regulator YiaG
MELGPTNLSILEGLYESTFQETSSEINARFGARVREMREMRNLSQEEFAVLLLVPFSYIAEIESGRRSASIIELAAIAQQFHISISDLLLGL